MKQLTIKEYRERLLLVMSRIDALCRENGIVYSIVYGTLLGSVRHRGFIPWDDDMDIAMTRGEYDKLKAILAEHAELELNCIDIRDHEDTIYPCAKICDARTVVTESSFRPVKGYGAFVDVFLFDNLPDDERERKKFKLYARYQAKLIQHSAKRRPGKPNGPAHAFLLYAAFAYSHCFSTRRLIQKLDAYCAKYNDRETKYFGVPYFISIYRKSDFDKLIDMPFEGLVLRGPENYENVLNDTYENYRELPPLEERETHLVTCYWRE